MLKWWQVWFFLVLLTSQTQAQSERASTAPLYFRQYAVTESRLLELADDGKYRLLERDHDGVDEVDLGAWDEVSTGQLRLVSWRFKEAIDSPPFKLSWVTTETVSELRLLDSALSDLLGTMKMPTVSGSEAEKYLSLALDATKVKPGIDYDWKKTDNPKPLTRAEIEAFRTKVAEAITSAVPVSIVARRQKQRGVAYLEIAAINEYPWVGMKRGLVSGDAALGAITTAHAADRIRGLFVEIAKEEIEREATSPQPYLFVPKFSAEKCEVPGEGETTETACFVSRDPAVDPAGAIRTYVPDLEVLSTSTTEEIAGYYANPGPTIKHGLSGSKLYLFPDRTYFYLRWADIMPGLIESRGTWDVVGEYVLLTDDGTVQRKQRHTNDYAYLPLRFKEEGTTVTGLLGFPESYERMISRDDISSRWLLFRAMERVRDIQVEEAAELKAELMRKHWRPDYAAGKPGSKPPDW